MFSSSVKGVNASATIYSIIVSAKENDLNPYQYLTCLFEMLPNSDLDQPEALDSLLLWSKHLPDTCRVR
ncbi:transposase domain-containing protein [Bacillus coahuilensis]|uniref:transposase domain-containing protein n=1 Tax=Bacillus coahuilensis TaxID=408580 RepID=UPI0009D72FC2